jgi:predicted HTH transcriptional regulator
VWIFSKPIDQLGGEELRFLIANRIRETTTLEFKRAMHDSQPLAVLEMLRDVSSMANAEGGIMILGMDEDGQGVAKKLVNVPDPERQSNRLVSSCLSGITERIPGLRAVPISYGRGTAIVVQIPRSHRRPHMVTYQGANEFWMRHDRQKSKMSVAELRTAVTMTEELQT